MKRATKKKLRELEEMIDDIKERYSESITDLEEDKKSLPRQKSSNLLDRQFDTLMLYAMNQELNALTSFTRDLNFLLGDIVAFREAVEAVYPDTI